MDIRHKKIPLVVLDKCEIEVVTEKKYSKYVTTEDGKLDLSLEGGEGDADTVLETDTAPESNNADVQQSADQKNVNTTDNSEGNSTVNVAMEDEAPSLEMSS